MYKILIAASAALLIGCGDSQTATTTNVYVDDNTTEIIVPIEELPKVSPYGSGTIHDPFVIKANGLYDVDTDTYLITNSLDLNCTLTVNDFTNDVFDVYVYDSGYNAVLTNEGNISYLLPKYDKYNINIKSYVPIPVGIFSNCWE
ncbi:MAG: hypothetical protein DRP93_05595 [Candidatus Neomarinimicrobiota bacterium]|nr:MAG: hypothetical protein DRP93_05595 [Candidatus Neomarinimicrobiota bacterium]